MMKSILLIYTILFYGIAFFWRSYQTWRKTGINPYRLQHQDSVHGLAVRIYRLISVTSVVVVVIFTFWDLMLIAARRLALLEMLLILEIPAYLRPNLPISKAIMGEKIQIERFGYYTDLSTQ